MPNTHNSIRESHKTLVRLLVGSLGLLILFPSLLSSRYATTHAGGNNQDWAVNNPTPSITRILLLPHLVGFKLVSPIIEVISISPTTATAGGPGFTLSVTGTNFFDGVIVRWNGSDRPTTFVDSNQLTAQISAEDIQSPGTTEVTVFVPGDGISPPFTFAVTCVCGYEGDLSPRPYGSNTGVISIADWVQIGRFVSGLDTSLGLAACEFQRADCAPRGTLGNGSITVSDWVQAGRYAAGLDPPVCAGGPTAPPNLVVEVREETETERLGMDKTARYISFGKMRFQLVQNLTTTIEMETKGNENAVGFTIAFDPAQMKFVNATKGNDANEGMLSINADHAKNGRIGIALALAPGQVFPHGSRQIVLLAFESFTNKGRSALRFGDDPVRQQVVGVDARELRAHFLSSTRTFQFIDHP